MNNLTNHCWLGSFAKSTRMAFTALLLLILVTPARAVNEGIYCPEYLFVGRIFFGSVNLSLYATKPAYLDDLRKLDSHGKPQDKPERIREVEKVRNNLRSFHRDDPSALDIYIALSQIDPEFRDAEHKRLSSVNSSSPRLERVKAVWMDWCSFWENYRTSRNENRADAERIAERMAYYWNQKHETMIGVMLLDVQSFTASKNKGQTMEEMIRHLGGEKVYQDFVVCRKNNFQTPPPSVKTVPRQNLRPLRGITGKYWTMAGAVFVDPKSVDKEGNVIVPDLSEAQQNREKFFADWGDAIEARYKAEL